MKAVPSIVVTLLSGIIFLSPATVSGQKAAEDQGPQQTSCPCKLGPEKYYNIAYFYAIVTGQIFICNENGKRISAEQVNPILGKISKGLAKDLASKDRNFPQTMSAAVAALKDEGFSTAKASEFGKIVVRLAQLAVNQAFCENPNNCVNLNKAAACYLSITKFPAQS